MPAPAPTATQFNSTRNSNSNSNEFVEYFPSIVLLTIAGFVGANFSTAAAAGSRVLCRTETRLCATLPVCLSWRLRVACLCVCAEALRCCVCRQWQALSLLLHTRMALDFALKTEASGKRAQLIQLLSLLQLNALAARSVLCARLALRKPWRQTFAANRTDAANKSKTFDCLTHANRRSSRIFDVSFSWQSSCLQF